MRHRDPRHISYLITYAATFAAVWLLIGLSSETRPAELGVALVLQLTVAALVITWRADTSVGRFAVATVAFDVSIAFMRDASGTNPGVGILLLLPAVLAAVRASRTELYLALLAAGVTVYVPEIWPGGTQYPASALRPATMLLLVGVVVGEVVLRLVVALREGQAAQQRMRQQVESKLVVEDALRQVATLVAAGAPPAQLFSDISQHMARIAGSSMAAVLRFDEERMVGTLLGGWRSDRQVTIGREWDLRGETAAAEVFRTGRPKTIITYPDSPEIDGATAAVSTPIFVSGRLWGAASAVYRAGDAIPSEIQDRFGRFCELVAVAISNAEAVSQLVEHATIDALTGIPNRRSFDIQLARELERSERNGRQLSIVLFDVDTFKRVNDLHGHLTGDRVLAQVARILRSEARSGETVARLGGEEFIWLLPDTSAENAMIAAERVRRAVSAVRFEEVGHLSLSAGVNSNRWAKTRTLLLEGADEALYTAKTSGRDQTVAAPASLSSAEDRVKPAAA